MAISDVSAEQIAARATELAIEQRARLATWVQTHGARRGFEFYIQMHEIETSAKILDLLSAYAVEKGYIEQDQDLKASRSLRGY